LEAVLRSEKTLRVKSGAADDIIPHKAGFFCVLAVIISSLVSARVIFLNHAWNFSWMPAGLASVFVFFFVVVHLGIGPCCVLFCDTVSEVAKLRQSNSCHAPGVLLREFAKEYVTVKYLLHGIIAYGLVYGALISYTNLKPAIPLLNPSLYDDFLFRLDRALISFLSCGGFFALPKSATIALFFDKIYFHMWTLACLTLVASFRDRVTFWRFTVAWCLAFVLSIPVSVLFPSLGPAFYKPELFAHISNTFSAEVMKGLWNGYLRFKMDPYSTLVVRANGIVAMPSLHIALVYLSVVVLGTYYPRLRFVLYGLLILFVFATVYLGWHYLSDGIVVMILGWCAYKISMQWFQEDLDHM
jgi:hypothetical protein